MNRPTFHNHFPSLVKLSLVIVLLVITKITPCYGQTKVIKKFDKKGKLAYKLFYKKGKLVKSIEYYPNGLPKKETNMKDGQFFGWRNEYDSTGIKIQSDFIIGVDMVPYDYYKDTTRHSNLLSIDAVSCKQIVYYPNGQKKSQGYIIHAKRIGLWTFYKENGEPDSTHFYKSLTNSE